MGRHIDADVFSEYVNNISTHWLNNWSTLGVLAAIDKQPAVDAVPVVRCKDCEWFHLDEGGYCGQGQCCCNENGFCSYGERKKEDGKIH